MEYQSIQSGGLRPRPGLRSNRESGGALALALLAVTTVTMAGASFLQMSAATTRRQVAAIDNKRAFYLAEAGLAEAYAGLKVGKTGNVGTEAAPAKFGEGLYWVEAEDTPEGLIQLTCTGLAGSGRVELSFYVQPGEPSAAQLGIFSRNPLVVQAGTEIDGYDSVEGYSGGGTGGAGGASGGARGGGQISVSGGTGGSGGGGLLFSTAEVDVRDSRAGFGLEPPDGVDIEIAPGRIGSDGAITVIGSAGAPTTLSADVVCGPGQAVTEVGATTIEGATDPNTEYSEFPVVELPAIVAEPAGIEHGLATPFVIPSGRMNYPHLRVLNGAEVVVQGPATLLLGELDVQSGGELTLDTSAGPIDVYVDGTLEFDAGSAVSLVGTDPNMLRIQVAGTDAATLAGTGDFYGYVYAPDATVQLAASLEFFGSLVADQLVLDPGVQAHFDQALAENAVKAALPKQLSWSIVEMTVVRDPSGRPATNPFDALGLDPATLDWAWAAHEDQLMDIKYYDLSDTLLSYSGLESGFDWTQVKWIARLTRERGGVTVDVSPRSVTGPVVRGVLAGG